jgi:ADP-heptose:LPS heptosyltransferase
LTLYFVSARRLARFTRLTGATERIGIFDTFREYHGQTKTSGRARHYTTAYPFETHPPHRVDQYLLPLQALNVPPPQSKRLSIGYTEADRQTVREYMRETLGDKPFVVIAPLTGWPSRIWPMERFAAVADEIAHPQQGMKSFW